MTVWVDTDGGVDDALALALATSPAELPDGELWQPPLQLVGVSVVRGIASPEPWRFGWGLDLGWWCVCVSDRGCEGLSIPAMSPKRSASTSPEPSTSSSDASSDSSSETCLERQPPACKV
jgi:hypothetical protein